MGPLEAHRAHFAELITANVGQPEGRLTAAFASTCRERFMGPGPWKVVGETGYIETSSDDPAFLYQNVAVALLPEKRINNGEPALHAACLASLNIQEGETVIHLGAGSGYYTALLAKLTGSAGRVIAYEIEPELVQRATANLTDLQNVTIHLRSGAEAPLPSCDAIYVNAGATAPLDIWLDSLRSGGRLLFPLTDDSGAGGMLLVTKVLLRHFNARFMCPVLFIPCFGARDTRTAKKLSEAFGRGDFRRVQSLRRDSFPDGSCWCSGNGWWLSTDISAS